jgi:hypothetical protein
MIEAEEEKNTDGALASVDIAGHVHITVPDKFQSSAGLEMATVVDRPDDVAPNALYRSQVLSGGPLHEMAHVPDGERNVRSGVNQVS